jgi:hypothetical protein
MDFQVDPQVRQRVLSTVWDNFYENGGYGMYPTTLFGFLLVLSACLYLLRPESRYLRFVLTTGCLTIAWGVLGTLTALMVVFRFVQHVAAADQLRAAVIGCAEAINNLVLALILVALGGLVTLFGVVRQHRREARPAA